MSNFTLTDSTKPPFPHNIAVADLTLIKAELASYHQTGEIGESIIMALIEINKGGKTREIALRYDELEPFIRHYALLVTVHDLELARSLTYIKPDLRAFTSRTVLINKPT